MNSPNHIAIIMDGNGRWGLKKFNNRLTGHEAGVKNIRPIVEYSIKNGVKTITFFALSYDNLIKRNSYEIKNILSILRKYLTKNLDYFKKKKIAINFIGEKKKLDSNLVKLIKFVSNETRQKRKIITINLAFNYSSKKEIISSFKHIVKRKLKLTEKNISRYLYSNGIDDPDILIRTGGYKRLSDFLLWQISYTELFFFKKLWPDFKVSDLKNTIKKFNLIKRNYGA